MKLNSLFRSFILLLLVTACKATGTVGSSGLSGAGVEGADSDLTTIYFVRHAEKVTSNPNDPDPDLTEEGLARAEELRLLLQEEDIDALYTTNYKRTRNTLRPLAEERGLELQTYDSKDYQRIKERILAENNGNTIVVAGHSNTLMPLVEAYGVEKPFDEIDESDYFYIFKVTVNKDNQATLLVSRYGRIIK